MERHCSLRNPRNGEKFLSLGREEAGEVLEIYVRRSLSVNDGTRKMSCKLEPNAIPPVAGNWKNSKKVQRAASDLHARSRLWRKAEKVTKSSNSFDTAPQANDTCRLQSQGNTMESLQNTASKDKDSKGPKSGKKTPSMFKVFLGFFWKKDGEKIKVTVPTPVHPPGNIRLEGDTTLESHVVCPEGKGNKRNNSIKRVFSLKKNVPEECRAASPERRPIIKCKVKKPTSLPLKNICRPASRNYDVVPEYYERVSEEIEQIVKQNEPINGASQQNEKLCHSDGQETDREADSTEVLIQKIIALLKVEGDHINEKINEDATFQNFFQDISYNSFKHLADVYVEREVKAKVTKVSPEVKKFAFTLDFTAKVAGICNHTVNRIMGFGHQYLQETFPEFSQCRHAWDDAVYDIVSPD